MSSESKGSKVERDIPDMKPDSSGSLVTVVKLDADEAYVGVPDLLKRVIEEADDESWRSICAKIDYIYANLDHVFDALDEETKLEGSIRSEIEKGRILLFKPNIVVPISIDPFTHGEATTGSAATEWALIAALMRWFHDNLGITYHQMAVGEAATATSMYAGYLNLALSPDVAFTPEAMIEGRSGEFYGGWGFYFVRKYLADTHQPSHEDDPMKGYEESVSGTKLPPRASRDKLMVYDMNRVTDAMRNGRTVSVPGGINFQEITLHKVLIGGDPEDPEDMRDYPGCILVNVPRLKMHSIDLITNVVKNLGIGLYPTEAAGSSDPENPAWRYSFPFNSACPGMKSEVPHAVWVSELDDETGLPKRGEDGGYIVNKTGGMAGTQADVIKATLNQGVSMLHVVDAVQSVNYNHTGSSSAVKVPEGLILSSLDPVALDVVCARYCFKMVPMEEARILSKERGFPGEFFQRVPIPSVDGKNISNGEGFDSPLFRYNLYEYAESRGIGREKYHIRGWDAVGDKPLVSVGGHLGWVEGSEFHEVMTSAFYYNNGTLFWDLQETLTAYIEANDALTGSSYRETLYDAFDENSDGVIDYGEMGRNGFWHVLLRLFGTSIHRQGVEKYGYLRGGFNDSSLMKYGNPDWNPEGHDFLRDYLIVSAAAMAYGMSRMDREASDPFYPGMTWGQGKWPSLQYVSHLSKIMGLYGSNAPTSVSPYSIYGYAFQYADKGFNGSKYTGDPGVHCEPEAVDKYIEAVRGGGEPLGFVLYVPEGYGRLEGAEVPNVVETDDPAKLFAASFDGGRETWG